MTLQDRQAVSFLEAGLQWKVSNVSAVRFALCHQVRALDRPVAAVARAFGVSRKTAYEWLARFDPLASAGLASAGAMGDRSRRPHASPGKVGEDVEAAVLAVRDRHGWGHRKIHAVLLREGRVPLPALRTVADVLRRRGRVGVPAVPATAVQRFERSGPNELWQIDHKGPIEVGRQKVVPLSVIDDHSRYALGVRPDGRPHDGDHVLGPVGVVRRGRPARGGLVRQRLRQHQRPGPQLFRRQAHPPGHQTAPGQRTRP